MTRVDIFPIDTDHVLDPTEDIAASCGIFCRRFPRNAGQDARKDAQ
jgi:hypothetical protein